MKALAVMEEMKEKERKSDIRNRASAMPFSRPSWGLMPKREGATRHIAKGAIILSRTFIPSGKDENPTDKDTRKACTLAT